MKAIKIQEDIECNKTSPGREYRDGGDEIKEKS